MPLPAQTCPTCGGSGIVPGAGAAAAAPQADPAAASGGTSDLEQLLGLFQQGSRTQGAGLDPNSPGNTQTLVPGDASGKIAQLMQAFMAMAGGAG